MTWESSSKTCRAEFEATSLSNQCLSCKTCLFGNYIYIVTVKLYVLLYKSFRCLVNFVQLLSYAAPYHRQIYSYCTPMKQLKNSSTLSAAKEECAQLPSCKMFYSDCGQNTYYYCYDNPRIKPSYCDSILHYKRGNISVFFPFFNVSFYSNNKYIRKYTLKTLFNL